MKEDVSWGLGLSLNPEDWASFVVGDGCCDDDVFANEVGSVVRKHGTDMQRMNCQVVAPLQIGVASATAGFSTSNDNRF